LLFTSVKIGEKIIFTQKLVFFFLAKNQRRHFSKEYRANASNPFHFKFFDFTQINTISATR